MPVSCADPLDFNLELEPWNVPLGSAIERATSPGPFPLGCSNVPFDPSIAAAPTGKLAESASGLDFRRTCPTTGLHNRRRDRRSRAQARAGDPARGDHRQPLRSPKASRPAPKPSTKPRSFDSKPGEGCPEASKIGCVQISTPLVEGQSKAPLYLATPYENQTAPCWPST